MTSQRTDVDRLFQAALDMRHAGDLERAKVLGERALLAAAGMQGTVPAAIHGEIGFLCLELGDFEAARDHYAAAVALAPRAEVGSLGLFHSLAALGNWTEAFREVVRFVSLKDSPAYRELLEGVDGDNPEEVRRLVEEARTLLAKPRATGPSTSGEAAERKKGEE